MCSHSLSTWTPMKCGWNDTCTKVCKSSIRGGGRGKVGNFFHFKEFEFWRRLQNKQWRTLNCFRVMNYASNLSNQLHKWISETGHWAKKISKKCNLGKPHCLFQRCKINIFWNFKRIEEFFFQKNVNFEHKVFIALFFHF